MKFQSIVLPKKALSRSWLLRQADQRYDRFAILLGKLDPDYKIDYTRGKLSAYYALLANLSDRFPVFYTEEDTLELDDQEGWSVIDSADEFGIPIDLRGRDYSARFNDESHVAYAAAEWFTYYDRCIRPDCYEATLKNYVALCSITAELEPYVHMPYKHTAIGYQLKEPWSALNDLVNYCRNEIESFWLDNSHEDVIESGGSYPRWSIGEIRAIENEWRRIEPVYQRIEKLAKFIDARPKTRVPLMLDILSGGVHQQVMVRVNSKPLTEVFSEA